MAKYHIRKDGTPGICHAQEGNCPLGGSENHVEAETLEQAQQYFDDKNEKIARLNKQLRHDFNSYTDEEKTIFMNMYDEDGHWIDYEDLPESMKEKIEARTGKMDFEGSAMLIIHRDDSETAFWSTEASDNDNPLGTLDRLLDDEDKFNRDIKNLDDPNIPQAYKDKLNEYIDEYINGSWDDFTKIPIEGGKGYVLVEGDFEGQRNKEITAEQRLEKAKSLDEYDVEEYLNSIYEEAFDIEPENAYTFSEEGDWSYEKDGIEVEYFVDTYEGEDYNTLNISDNGKLVRSFRLYPDDYDGESFDRIETVK